MKRLLSILALWGCLACVAVAEQRVIVVDSWLEHCDLSPVTRLLSQGWRITHVTSAGFVNRGVIQTIFVLESPPPKEVAK